MKPLHVISVSSEMSPYSKSGGLGDVAAALPKHVARFGHRVTSITPYYGFIKKLNLPLETVGEETITLTGVPYHVKFKRISGTGAPEVIFISNEELFGRYQVYMYGHESDALRFYVFDWAAVAYLTMTGIVPSVLHCHDWHTGLVPTFLKTAAERHPALAQTATLFTIHNLPFQMQGNWWEVPIEKADDGRHDIPTDPKDIRWINFTRRGICGADAINTVSVRYAEEILTPDFGQGLDRLLRRREKHVYGIINGVDYNIYNPQFDRNIWVSYDWNTLYRKRRNKRELQKLIGLQQDEETPLIGMVHRLTEQKGFNLIRDILPTLMQLRLQLVIVGSGDRNYVSFFRKIAKKYPKQIGICTPFTEELASKAFAGSDMFLMPSRYEPCGISQLISLRYGSIPIVHKTGGLSDTIEDFDPRSGKGTGFLFPRYTPEDLLIAIVRALETYKYPQVWEHLSWQAMQESYSWDIPAEKYVELYRKTIRAHQLRKE